MEKKPNLDQIDIDKLTDTDEIAKLMVFSCSCLTKTPELKYHSEDCTYRRLGNRLNSLEGGTDTGF